MHDMCQLVDGPGQEERDRIFREQQPRNGFPNPWADPEFQQWMWTFDAREAASRAWQQYCQDKKTERGQEEIEKSTKLVR